MYDIVVHTANTSASTSVPQVARTVALPHLARSKKIQPALRSRPAQPPLPPSALNKWPIYWQKGVRVLPTWWGEESAHAMELDGLKGVMISDGVLFSDVQGCLGDPHWQLVPDAKEFLLRLQYSRLRVGVLFPEADPKAPGSQQREALLAEIGVLDAIEIAYSRSGQAVTESLKLFESFRGIPAASLVYVYGQLSIQLLAEDERGDERRTRVRWLAWDGSTERMSEFEVPVPRLRDVPMALACFNKKILGPRIVIVGHCMKWSRELDFLKRGAFPIAPTEQGLSFVNIQLDGQLKQQLSNVDVVLHKATDEALTLGQTVQFSGKVIELQKHLEKNPRICIIDPFDRILPLLDRMATQEILRKSDVSGQQIVRSPRFREVDSFEEPFLSRAMESAGLTFPVIVKSRTACGASDAHTMAVVFRKEGFDGLKVPLPATIQEYIDHGAIQFKFYILGSKLLFARRKSTPDASSLALENNDAPAVVFDSLRSLPTSRQEIMSNSTNGDPLGLNLAAIETVAKRLKENLGLTIIGFDLVVQAGTNDHVIVDVNYFPSFKEVPNEEAMPALWNALLTAFRQWSQ